MKLMLKLYYVRCEIQRVSGMLRESYWQEVE